MEALPFALIVPVPGCPRKKSPLTSDPPLASYVPCDPSLAPSVPLIRFSEPPVCATLPAAEPPMVVAPQLNVDPSTTVGAGSALSTVTIVPDDGTAFAMSAEALS